MGSPFPPRKIEKACAVHRHQTNKKNNPRNIYLERQRGRGVLVSMVIVSRVSVETVSLCALVISSSFLRDLHSGSAG